MALQLAALLLLPFGAMSAEVDYQHPNLTIVANDEPLDSVLKAVSKEMQIFVTTPTGLNPQINCDIRNQPIKLAFRKLMGGMSYSLEWKDDGQQLVGLTVLSVSGGSVAEADSDGSAVAASVSHDSVQQIAPDIDAALVPQNNSTMAVERRDRNVRTDKETEAREIEMELRRQEEVIAHEAKIAEEKVRNEAQMAEYFEAHGINPNP